MAHSCDQRSLWEVLYCYDCANRPERVTRLSCATRNTMLPACIARSRLARPLVQLAAADAVKDLCRAVAASSKVRMGQSPGRCATSMSSTKSARLRHRSSARPPRRLRSQAAQRDRRGVQPVQQPFKPLTLGELGGDQPQGQLQAPLEVPPKGKEATRALQTAQ